MRLGDRWPQGRLPAPQSRAAAEGPEAAARGTRGSREPGRKAHCAPGAETSCRCPWTWSCASPHAPAHLTAGHRPPKISLKAHRKQTLEFCLHFARGASHPTSRLVRLLQGPSAPRPTPTLPPPAPLAESAPPTCPPFPSTPHTSVKLREARRLHQASVCPERSVCSCCEDHHWVV